MTSKKIALKVLDGIRRWLRFTPWSPYCTDI